MRAVLWSRLTIIAALLVAVGWAVEADMRGPSWGR